MRDVRCETRAVRRDRRAGSRAERADPEKRCRIVLFALLVPALSTLLAVGTSGGGGLHGGQPSAALKCANPSLPAAILAGANGAVSSDVDATPLRVAKVTSGDATFQLALAEDEPTRERGLMCVTALRPRAGMLFAFATSSAWTFWMKNTVVPLDMVWLESDGTVTHVASEVPASTLDTPNDKVARRAGHGRYVIELASGEADRAGIHEGMKFDLPAVHPTQ